MTNCDIPKPTEEQVIRAERLLSCGVLVADMAQLLANHEAETKRLRELSECCSCPTDTLDGPNHATICRACAKEMVAEHDVEINRLSEAAHVERRRWEQCYATLGGKEAEVTQLLAILVSIVVAFRPVLEWYEGDGDRELFEMIMDAVADLQTDRAEKLRLRKEIEGLDRQYRQADQRRWEQCYTTLGSKNAQIAQLKELLAAASKPVVSDSKEDLTMGGVVVRLNEQHTKNKQLQHKILDLHTEIASLHRAVRASVPTSYKTCGGGLGAVQSYIADLERENKRMKEQLIDAWF